jgi:hypothetical protein
MCTIKIISITPPSVIKIYLFICMPLHVSANNNHHQKANQQLKLLLSTETCKGIYTYKYILITLGGVIDIILIVSTSVTDQNE